LASSDRVSKAGSEAISGIATGVAPFPTEALRSCESASLTGDEVKVLVEADSGGATWSSVLKMHHGHGYNQNHGLGLGHNRNHGQCHCHGHNQNHGHGLGHNQNHGHCHGHNQKRGHGLSYNQNNGHGVTVTVMVTVSKALCPCGA
jgi:hypothetical protein